MLENYVVKHIRHIFASVFHGISFKVRLVHVVMTSIYFN
jgi:hypothetical protein